MDSEKEQNHGHIHIAPVLTRALELEGVHPGVAFWSGVISAAQWADMKGDGAMGAVPGRNRSAHVYLGSGSANG
jgi:hypothetical protein